MAEQNPDDWHNVEWNGAEGQELAEPQEQLGQQAAAAGQGGQGQHGPADDDDDEYFADWAQAAGQEAAGPQEQQGHGAAEEGDEAAGQEAAGPQEQEEHGAAKDDDDEEEDAAAEDNGDDVLFAQFAAWAQSEIQEEAEPEEEEEQGAAAADGGIDAAAGAVALWLNQVGPEVNQQLVAAAWHVANNPQVQAAVFGALAAAGNPEFLALLGGPPLPDGPGGGAPAGAVQGLWARLRSALLEQGAAVAQQVGSGLQVVMQGLQSILAGAGAGGGDAAGAAGAGAPTAVPLGRHGLMAVHGGGQAGWAPWEAAGEEDPALSEEQVLGLFIVILVVMQMLLHPV